MPFSIIRDEIAHQSADVVIVPANSALTIDGGAGLAIGRVAGLAKLQAACDTIGGCTVGHAVITPAFDFPAKGIVHAVGPAWDGSSEAAASLASAYTDALALAAEAKAQTVALALISSGAQGCPAEISLHVALMQVKAFLESHPDVEVRIIVFSASATSAGRELFPDLAQFIDNTYAEGHENLYSPDTQVACAAAAQAWPDEDGDTPDEIPTKTRRRRSEFEFGMPIAAGGAFSLDEVGSVGFAAPSMSGMPEGEKGMLPRSLEEILDEIDAPFSTTLLTIIDERGLDDAEVYKRANLSRQHFSKIRSNPNYQPTKRTVLALAVALELDLDETEDLLGRAGLAFSPASKADLIVRWFIGRNDFDIFAINEALYAYDQPILG